MIKQMIAGVVGAAALTAAGSASAATFVSYMDWSNKTGSVTQVAAPVSTNAWAKITIDEVDDFNVTVLVELKDGLKFVDTGNAGNHLPFTFNMYDNPNSNVTVLTPNPNTDIVYGPANKPKTNLRFIYQAPDGTYNQSAFGDFANGFICCGNGGSDARSGPLKFNVNNGSGISFLGDPVGTGNRFYSNQGGWWFAADVVDTNGATFLIAARDATCIANCGTTPGVPEPTTWALMILGFGSAGAILRRQRRMAIA
jgi:hypothetical protein